MDEHTFFNEHGIATAVAAARPYVRWTTDDREPVREAYADLSSGQRGKITGWAGQSDGWVITRHAPPGLGLDRVYAEIRPDNGVKTAPAEAHYHPTQLPETLPELPKGCLVSEASKMVAHIERHPDHKKVNSEKLHFHQNVAKYVFPPGPRIDITYEHDHSTMRPERHEAHVARWHKGEDVDGAHEHTIRVKDKTVSLAKRIDVHPLAMPLIESAERVFFVIEGCIKADAILSQGEAVFSVPSVTLWDAAELEAFADRYLNGKTVIVVPDADGMENPLVREQALLCRTFLRHVCRLEAEIAAPPYAGYVANHDIKGVDDFLAAGGDLDDLEVYNREIELPLNDLYKAGLMYRRRDRAANYVRAFTSLALLADDEGRVFRSLETLGHAMGMKPRTTQYAVEDFLALGVVEVDRPLESKRAWFSHKIEWKDRPVITIAKHLRAVSRPTYALKDIAPRRNKMDALVNLIENHDERVAIRTQLRMMEARWSQADLLVIFTEALRRYLELLQFHLAGDGSFPRKAISLLLQEVEEEASVNGPWADERAA